MSVLLEAVFLCSLQSPEGIYLSVIQNHMLLIDFTIELTHFQHLRYGQPLNLGWPHLGGSVNIGSSTVYRLYE